MRTSPLWLLALFPWGSAPPAHAPSAPETPGMCALAIEVHVTADLAIGTLDLSVSAGDVEHGRVPYGVTFCWGASEHGCEGLEVRVRLLANDDAPLPQARAARTRSWISN